MSSTDFQSLDDFLENDRFKAWVKGERPDDQSFWEDWMAANPEKIQLYEMAVATLLMMEGKSADISAEYVKNKVQDIISQMESMPVTRTISLRRWMNWAVAAMFLVAAGIGWLIWSRHTPTYDSIVKLVAPEAPDEIWVNRTNEEVRPLLVNLPDGSSVLLTEGSRIRFEKKMDKSQREVYLEGEGFFEVAKNPERPFLVYANGLITKVLGTSFRVRAFANEPNVTVTVKTGKVTVMPNSADPSSKSGKEFTLMPNEEVSLVKENEQYILKSVPEKAILPSLPIQQQRAFEFRFTPVSEVFAELEKAYGVPIDYDKVKMQNCTLTATLTDEPFLDKVRLICLGTESTFELSDDKIIIHSKGCP